MSLYLVTGGAGFIGSHLVDALLSAGHRVRVLDNLSSGRLENVAAAAEFVHGEITDRGTMEAVLSGVAGCYHLAAIASVERSRTEWLETHHVNLTGTLNLFAAASREQAHRGSPLPIVYSSTAAVYGDTDAPLLSETMVPRPISAYGADKLGCELHAVVAARVHEVPTVGLRFFNVYGPRQDPSSPYSGVISIFSERIPRGEAINIYGDGEQIRDFIEVSDVVEALLLAMETANLRAEVVNVCTGIGITVRQLADLIAQISDTGCVINRCPPRAGDLRRSIGDPGKAKARLGFVATAQLRDGLQRLLHWNRRVAQTAGRSQDAAPTSG